MFKELGALIDAAGEVAGGLHGNNRVGGNSIAEALSDKEGEGDHLMGCLVENPNRFRELDLGETIDLKEYKSKDVSIIVNANEVDEDE